LSTDELDEHELCARTVTTLQSRPPFPDEPVTSKTTESQEPIETGKDMTTFGDTAWDDFVTGTADREAFGQLLCVRQIPFNDGHAAFIEADCFTITLSPGDAQYEAPNTYA